MSVEISSIYNVQVAPNEIKFNHGINRNLIKLLENDLALRDFYNKVLNSMNIMEFQDSEVPYDIGDYVWYRYEDDLYLLQCVNQNNKVPFQDDNGDFMSSGWKDMNSRLNILSYGIEQALSSKIQLAIQKHENDLNYHEFGKIQIEDQYGDDYINQKILNKNLKNINQNRKRVMFPGVMKRLTPDNVIMNGYYRKYDNGVLEYDIIFRLGEDELDQSGSRDIFGTTSTISANDVEFKSYQGINQTGDDKQENDRYFYNTANMDIFKTESEYSSMVGYSKQGNRSDFVNTYFGVLNFPEKFKDLNYMIFSNSVMCHGYTDDVKIYPSSNDITFCNKTRGSVTVMNVFFENQNRMSETGYNAEHGGLALNTFHCKIIGRYK